MEHFLDVANLDWKLFLIIFFQQITDLWMENYEEYY